MTRQAVVDPLSKSASSAPSLASAADVETARRYFAARVSGLGALRHLGQAGGDATSGVRRQGPAPGRGNLSPYPRTTTAGSTSQRSESLGNSVFRSAGCLSGIASVSTVEFLAATSASLST
jgi:hypothetical protein